MTDIPSGPLPPGAPPAARPASATTQPVPQSGAPQAAPPQGGAEQPAAQQSGTQQTGAPPSGAPQSGAPQSGAPPTAAPPTGVPQTGAPQSSAPAPPPASAPSPSTPPPAIPARAPALPPDLAHAPAGTTVEGEVRTSTDGQVTVRTDRGDVRLDLGRAPVAQLLRPGTQVSIEIRSTAVQPPVVLVTPRAPAGTGGSAQVGAGPAVTTGSAAAAPTVPLAVGRIIQATVVPGPAPATPAPATSAPATSAPATPAASTPAPSSPAPSLATSSPPATPAPAATLPSASLPAGSAPSPTARAPVPVPGAAAAAPPDGRLQPAARGAPIPSDPALRAATPAAAGPAAPAAATSSIPAPAARPAVSGSPVPSGAAVAAPSSAPVAATAVGRIPSTPAPSTPAPAVSAPAASAPSSAPPATTLPNGAVLTVRVAAIADAARAESAPRAGTGLSREDGQPAVPTRIAGQIAGVTAAGRPVMQSPLGFLALDARADLRLGTRIALDVLASRGGAVQDRSAPLPVLAREWPALEAALRALEEQLGPAAARESTAAMPRPGPQLTAALVFFMSALRGGDVRTWLGRNAVQTLEATARGSGLMKALSDDFQTLQRAAEPSETGWRSFLIPITWDERRPIRLLTRRERRDGRDGRGGKPGTAFLVDLDLTNIGPFRLDGLVRNELLDLLIRTTRPLPGMMRQDIKALMDNTLERTGIIGRLSFRASPVMPPLPVDLDASATGDTTTVTV